VTGRSWAYAGAVLGGAVSIAANVAHSYVPPPDAGPDWTPPTGAVVGAVFWPVALLAAVEIMARTLWPDGRRWVAVRYAGLLPVASVAAAVSYRHMSGLLRFYREDWLTVRFGPLAVDGLMVMAAGALLAIAGRPDNSQVTIPDAARGAPDRRTYEQPEAAATTALIAKVVEATREAAQPVSYVPVIPEPPEGGTAVVYRFYDGEGSLLYVGCTVRPAVRLRAHQRRQPWWDEVEDSEIIWYPDMDQAADAELRAIHSERPVYNKGIGRYGWAAQQHRPAALGPRLAAWLGSAPEDAVLLPIVRHPGVSSTVVRPLPDWQAVARARSVSRSRAYEIIKQEPDAVAEARTRLAANGHAPADAR
jgi:hypothetical protein